MEGKVAALGSQDFVMPFSVMGMDPFVTEEGRDEILSAAKEIVEGSYTLIIVAENVSQVAEEVFAKVRDGTTPAILVVPFTAEPTGIATESLGKALMMATGINILDSAFGSEQ